jgi:hypothetical protein
LPPPFINPILVLQALRSTASAADSGAGQGDVGDPVVPCVSHPTEDAALTFYQVTLVDELQNPISGVDIGLTTPGGGFPLTTDGSGVVFLDQQPAGTGQAKVADLNQLATAMAKQESKPVRTQPLPDDDNTHIMLPSQLASIDVPSATPQTIMLITRTDLAIHAIPDGWGPLQLAQDGPWTLQQDETTATLTMHSEGLGKTVTILGAAPDPIPDPSLDSLLPLPVNSLWIPPSTYLVQNGDTLSSLAQMYLGDSSRGLEIWSLNGDPNNPPDTLLALTPLVMPDAAVPPWLSIPESILPDPTVVPPPPAAAPQFLSVDVDGFHEACFNQNGDAIQAVYDSIPTEPLFPPEPSANFEFFSLLEFYVAALEQLLQGNFDLHYEPVDVV